MIPMATAPQVSLTAAPRANRPLHLRQQPSPMDPVKKSIFPSRLPRAALTLDLYVRTRSTQSPLARFRAALASPPARNNAPATSPRVQPRGMIGCRSIEGCARMTDPDPSSGAPSASTPVTDESGTPPPESPTPPERPVNDRSGTTPPDPDEIAKQAREHAWNWFALHATQRMQAFNFFMVATAVLMAAYAALLEKHPIAAAVLAVVGAWLAFLFNRLDDRSRQLVDAGEKVLKVSQARLANLAGDSNLKILDAVDAVKRPDAKSDGGFVSQRWLALKRSTSSYRDVIYWVQMTIFAVFLGGFAYAGWLAVRPSQGGGVVPTVPIEHSQRSVIPTAPIELPRRGVTPAAPIELE